MIVYVANLRILIEPSQRDRQIKGDHLSCQFAQSKVRSAIGGSIIVDNRFDKDVMVMYFQLNFITIEQ